MGDVRQNHVPIGDRLVSQCNICLTILSCCIIDVEMVNGLSNGGSSCRSKKKWKFSRSPNLKLFRLQSFHLSDRNNPFHHGHDDVWFSDSICVDCDQSWMVSLQFGGVLSYLSLAVWQEACLLNLSLCLHGSFLVCTLLHPSTRSWKSR